MNAHSRLYSPLRLTVVASLWLAMAHGAARSVHAQSGAIQVEADAPGQVAVDNVIVGPTPLKIVDVPPGSHVVRIEFDAAGATRRRVEVAPGTTTVVHFAFPVFFAKAAYRRGFHLLLGGSVWGLLESNAALGAGAYGTFGFNQSLGVRLDFRTVALAGGGRYGATADARELGVELGLLPSLRINLSVRYSLELGVRVSLLRTSFEWNECNRTASLCPRQANILNLAVGPDISATSLRLGLRNQYELTLGGAALIVAAGKPTVYLQVGIGLTYLFLPRGLPAR